MKVFRFTLTLLGILTIFFSVSPLATAQIQNPLHLPFYDANSVVCQPGGATNTGGGSVEPDENGTYPVVGGGSLDGNPWHILSYPVGLDEEKAANAINVYIQERKPESPFVGLGDSFVRGGKLYNVNPFLAVGHLQHENGFATAPSGWHTTTPPSHNAFGRSASESQPHTIYTTGSGRQRLVYQWSSWAASLDGNGGTEDSWFKFINRRYLGTGEDSFKIPDGDFAKYISIYAPQSDGNNEAAYAGGLKETIDKILVLMEGGAVFTGTAITNQACQGVAGVAGANGWDLPGEGPNPMVYYSQRKQGDDPAVQGYFGNENYGPGPISYCGCGPTSWAMIVSTLTGSRVEPPEVADWASENGWQAPSDGLCGGSGWWWASNPASSEQRWGVRAVQVDLEGAAAALRNGALIIMSSNQRNTGNLSPFTMGGHLLVMRAVTDDGRFLFADPNDNPDYDNPTSMAVFNGASKSRTPISAEQFAPSTQGMWAVTPIGVQ